MKRPIFVTILACVALLGPVGSLEAQTFTYEKVHVFDGSDGLFPMARLIQAAGGAFYGTNPEGGTYGCGTVFRMASSGPPVEVLHAFNNDTEPAEGCKPIAGLLQAGDGFFYGTTAAGGRFNGGTLFKMSSAGAITVLFNFGDPNVISPESPQYTLIQGTDGLFYGTSARGGIFGWGTAFRANANGVVEVLHSFGSEHFEVGPAFFIPYSPGYVPPPVGAAPSSSLLQASDGSFYGMTYLRRPTE